MTEKISLLCLVESRPILSLILSLGSYVAFPTMSNSIQLSAARMRLLIQMSHLCHT